MARFAPPNAEGFYLPTTDSNDAQIIEDMDINSKEFKEWLVQLRRNLNNFSRFINKKVQGQFSLSEQVSGKQFFPVAGTFTGKGQSSQINRQAYFKTVDFGALPNAGVSPPIAHGIEFDANYSVINIYGAATKPTVPFDYISLPYSSPTLNQNIKLVVNATDVIITTAINYSAYTRCYVVIEYLKD